MMLDCEPGWGAGSGVPGPGDPYSAASDVAVELVGEAVQARTGWAVDTEGRALSRAAPGLGVVGAAM